MLLSKDAFRDLIATSLSVSADLCKNCHHVVARHEYTFSIMDEFQVNVLTWVCDCGVGGDNKSPFENLDTVSQMKY